jgi:hypothetical protein
MATILTKKKDTTGAPSSGDLTNSSGGAELAVNTADKRLYTKDSGGNVVEVGINPTSITTGTLNTSGAVVFNDAGANVDFRVESDTVENALFVEGSSGNVGIGTGTIEANTNYNTLEIAGKTSSGGAVIRLKTGDRSTAKTMLFCDTGGFEARVETNHPMVFNTNSTERMRINSAGNVGIGTSAPAANTRLHVNPGTGNNGLYRFDYGAGATSDGFFRITTESSLHTLQAVKSGGGVPLAFEVNSAEAMRIDTSGNLLVGTTSAVPDSGNGVKINAGTGARTSVVGSADTNANFAFTAYSTGAAAYRFQVGYGGTVFATNTTISAISDQRHKENIRDLDVGLDAVMQLKPRKFDWKEGKGKNIKDDRGFIAQEFEQVFPDLIDEWLDPAPEGEEPYKSVRQDLIPVLVKSIQELKTELDTVKAELATLKGN